jgi:membrane protease subunit (stomatin/prohibitin family)
MALNWFTRETQSFYIARPDHAVGEIVYLHPDRSIPRGTKITVRTDECALFFREGRYIGRLDAGSVQLDTANIPFLGHLLVDRLTGANHFISEIFFVALNETMIRLPAEMLGQYTDRNSANVVSISGGLNYTVRVVDPAKLITELGGQAQNSGAMISEIFNGRLRNQLRRLVGQRTQQLPALDVVSNVDAESLSQSLTELAAAEFRPLGIDVGRIFDLALSLDEASLLLLREFGKQEAELRLQEKGARLATTQGFEEFNLVQGRRRALEGLGDGLSKGDGPMLLSGGLGANLTGSSSRATQRAPSSRASGSVLSSGAQSFVIINDGIDSGPYTARQVALLAISKGLSLEELIIRGSTDSSDMQFAAALEPQIVAEYTRRTPKKSGNSPSTAKSSGSSATMGGPGSGQASSGVTTGSQAFDVAMAATLQDGVLTGKELQMLAELAVAVGLDDNPAAAKARVFGLLAGKNVQVDLER